MSIGVANYFHVFLQRITGPAIEQAKKNRLKGGW